MSPSPSKPGDKVSFSSEKPSPQRVKPQRIKPVEQLVKPVAPQLKKTKPAALIIIALLIIAVGVGTGYGLSLLTSGATTIKSTAEIAEEGIKVGDVVGSMDEKSFRDKASGVLDRGGIDGEGSHKLLREGGEDQTAYLTSSVVDLDQFVGHKVEVWGETFAAQKAGWLMDVGRIKVLELNAPKPF
jgi:hypothetical protein